jgi:hypothetical protein
MVAIRSKKNQYPGINAHLHSYWQARGGWDAFHNSHITYLTAALKAQLLPMGYTAEAQQSLQIRRFGEPAGRPESDVTVYDPDPFRRVQHSSPKMGNTQQVLAIPDFMSIEDEIGQYRAIGMYDFEPGQSEKGEPVVWLELLSPSNKPGGQDAVYYRNRRLKLLQTGVVFVELDYLHESLPTFERLMDDPHPYRIVVVDPRPEFLEGKAFPYPFHADTPMPKVDIPLNTGDVLTFDFNVPYQTTYQEQLFGLEMVDYSEFPLSFGRYSEDDQARIACRMLAVLKAVREGVDLESAGPLPVENLPLEQAVQAIEAIKS